MSLRMLLLADNVKHSTSIILIIICVFHPDVLFIGANVTQEEICGIRVMGGVQTGVLRSRIQLPGNYIGDTKRRTAEWLKKRLYTYIMMPFTPYSRAWSQSFLQEINWTITAAECTEGWDIAMTWTASFQSTECPSISPTVMSVSRSKSACWGQSQHVEFHQCWRRQALRSVIKIILG